MSILSNKKIFWRWWLTAAIIYLVVAGIITWHYGTGFLMPINDDTGHHIKLAENLIKYHTFSFDGIYSSEEPKPPLTPTNFLTPGYALWLALIYLIFKSFIPAIFIGALVFALSVPIIYFLAREITESNKIAFWSALIFMVEPLSIYHSGLLFTEQIFAPLFLVGVYWFIKYLKKGGLNLLAVSLITFSFATLIRPAIFYFLPALIIVVVLKESKISLKKALIFGLVAFVLSYSVVGVWLIRNKIVLNTRQLTGNGGAILFGYHYEPLVRSLGLKPENQKILGGGRDIFSVEYNKILGEFAIKEILNHKLAYLKMRAAYFPLFFISNSYDNVLNRLTGVTGFDKYFRWDLVSKFSKGSFWEGAKYLFSAPKSIAVLLIGSIFWFFVSILMIVGFWRLMKSGNKAVVIFSGLLIIYFAFITTPLLTARYRLPINPLIFILAISGFYCIKNKIIPNG